MTSALQFVALFAHLQAAHEDLDEWFIAQGAWIIDEELLYDTAEQIAESRALRKEQAGSLFKLKRHPVGTFRTYLNALARVYTKSTPEVIIVPSSRRQFPELQEFLRGPIRRERTWKAVKKAKTDSIRVLRENELHQVRATVDFENPLQLQRWTLLLVGFRTGLRAETTRSMVQEVVRIEGTGSNLDRYCAIM